MNFKEEDMAGAGKTKENGKMKHFLTFQHVHTHTQIYIYRESQRHRKDKEAEKQKLGVSELILWYWRER